MSAPGYCPSCGRGGFVVVIGQNQLMRITYFECTKCEHLWKRGRS